MKFIAIYLFFFICKVFFGSISQLSEKKKILEKRLGTMGLYQWVDVDISMLCHQYPLSCVCGVVCGEIQQFLISYSGLMRTG